MNLNTFVKICLTAMLLVVPLSAALTIAISREEWQEGDDQYSTWTVSRLGRADKGPIAYWIEYNEGFGVLRAVQLDNKANPTGLTLKIAEEGSDIWSPFMKQSGEVIVLSYTRTKGDISKARVGSSTTVELVVRTLDPDTFEPVGPLAKPLIAAELVHDGIDHSYLWHGDRLYCWFDTNGVSSLPEGVMGLYGGSIGEKPFLIPTKSVEPERVLYSISLDGEVETAYLQADGVDPHMLSAGGNSSGDPWGGIEILLLRKERDASDSMALFSMNCSEVWSWPRLREDIDTYKYVSRRGDDLYLVGDSIGFLNVVIGEDTEYPYITKRNVWSDKFWGVRFDEGTNATFCWSGEDKDRGDDDTSLHFITIDRAPEGPRVVQEHITRTDLVLARFLYVGNSTYAGIVLTTDTPNSYRGFVYSPGRFQERSRIITLAKPGSSILLAGILTPIAIGILALILSAKKQRIKAFRKMNLTQLQLFGEEQLRKAIGKDAKGWTKERMIEYLLHPEEVPQYSREEELRLFNLLPAKYIYFSLLVFGIIPMILNIIFDPTAHPAYLVGMGTHFDTIVITSMLSILFVLSLGEFGTGVLRRVTLIFMGLGLLIGEATLAVFIFGVASPSIELSYLTGMLFISASPLMVLALAGPFVFMFDRKREWWNITMVILFATPLMTALFTLISISSLEGALTTPGSHLRSSTLMMSLSRMITYMLLSMAGGLAFSGLLSLNTIKPMNRWTREDLDMARRLPFVTALLGASIFGGGLIIFGSFLRIGLLDELLLTGMMLGVGLGIALMGGAMWWSGLRKAKNMKELEKDISSIFIMVFFTPGLTLMAGFCLTIVLGLIGAIIGVFAMFFQIIFGNHLLQTSMYSTLAETKEKGVAPALVSTPTMKAEGSEKIKLPVPKKEFMDKMNKNTRGTMTTLIVLSVIGLLLNNFGGWIPHVRILRDIGVPDLACMAAYILAITSALAMTILQIRSLKRMRSPIKILGVSSNGPLIIIGMIGTILLGAVMIRSVYYLTSISFMLISSFFVQKMLKDAVSKRFLELPKEDRMVYPAELLIFKATSFTGPDQRLLDLPPEALAEALKGAKARKAPEAPKVPMTIERDRTGQILKGKLLFKEDARLLTAKMAKARKIALIGVITGCFGIVISGILLASASACSLPFSVLAMIFSITSIAISTIVLFGKGGKAVVEFYEGGVLDHSILSGKEIYIPWGNFSNYVKANDPSLGEIYNLRTPSGERVTIPLGQKDVFGHIETILSKIGKAEHAGFVDNRAKTELKNKVMPIVSLVLSLIGALIASTYIYYSRDQLWKIALMVFPACFLIFFLTTCMKYIRTERSPSGAVKAEGSKLAYRLIVGSVAACLVLTPILGVLAIFTPGGFVGNSIVMDSPPDDYMDRKHFNISGLYSIKDHIRVANDEELYLEDSFLQMDGNPSSPIVIWVDKGGSLRARNVSFITKDGSYGTSIEVHGRAEFSDCLFDGIWGDPSNENGQGGIEIYGEAVFRNCTIRNGYTNLFMLVGSKVEMHGCFLDGSDDDALEVNSGYLLMNDCLVSNVGWGIVAFDGSFCEVKNCCFSDVGDGIALSWSKAHVEDVLFRNVTYEALTAPLGSSLKEEGLTFQNVGLERSRRIGFDSVMFMTCLSLPVVIGILSLIVIINIWKKEKKIEAGSN